MPGTIPRTVAVRFGSGLISCKVYPQLHGKGMLNYKSPMVYIYYTGAVDGVLGV